MRLFPLAYQIYLWCLQVANKGHFPAVLAINCAWFSPVSLVSVLVSSFWPHDLSSHDGENKAFGALLLLRSNEDSLWCLTDGFWVGLFLISQGELLWTKVSTGLQVIPPVSVLSIAHMIRNCNDAEKGLCKNTAPFIITCHGGDAVHNHIQVYYTGRTALWPSGKDLICWCETIHCSCIRLRISDTDSEHHPC